MTLKTSLEAAARWVEREDARKAAWKKVQRGEITPFEADTPERVEFRRERLGQLGDLFAYDRMRQQSDFVPANFLIRGLVASQSVARLRLRDAYGAPAGTANGILVSSQLLLTTHSALPDPAHARYSIAEFDAHAGPAGEPEHPDVFEFDPDRLFLTDPEVGFTLVALHEQSVTGRSLQSLSWVPMIKRSGKILIGERVSIVEHPNGLSQQLTLRSHHLVDCFGNYFHVVGEFPPCSQGAAIFNDHWELVAIQHGGIPRLKKGELCDPLEWLADEAIRISRICEVLEAIPVDGDQALLLHEIVDPNLQAAPTDEPQLSLPLAPHADADDEPAFLPDSEAPLLETEAPDEATALRVEEADATNFEPDATAPHDLTLEPAPDESTSTPDLYAERPGYDPAFLGPILPLPILPPERTQHRARTEAGEVELKYQHFSALYDTDAHRPMLAAINLEGRHFHVSIDDEEPAPQPDPRVDADAQTEANPEDFPVVFPMLVSWGDRAELARSDTWHQTLTVSETGYLEDLSQWIVRRAVASQSRLSAFVGPQNGGYWMVVVWVDREAVRSAAFRLEEGVYQVSVRSLEEATGFDFGKLRRSDVFAGRNPRLVHSRDELELPGL